MPGNIAVDRWTGKNKSLRSQRESRPVVDTLVPSLPARPVEEPLNALPNSFGCSRPGRETTNRLRSVSGTKASTEYPGTSNLRLLFTIRRFHVLKA